MKDNDREAHLIELEKTTKDFVKLSQDWAEQDNDSLNFFGGVIDNTAVSVLSAYNLLSDKPQHIYFSHHSNWFTYMGIVHRNFFTNLVAYCEESTKIFCKKNNLKITTKKQRFMSQLDRTYGNAQVNAKQHKKLLSYVDVTPGFMDYVEAALVVLPNKRRTYWRNRFSGINVLRNRSSHSNSNLTANQIQILINGGFGEQVESEGVLFNTSLYLPLVKECIEFIKELQSSVET